MKRLCCVLLGHYWFPTKQEYGETYSCRRCGMSRHPH